METNSKNPPVFGLSAKQESFYKDEFAEAVAAVLGRRLRKKERAFSDKAWESSKSPAEVAQALEVL